MSDKTQTTIRFSSPADLERQTVRAKRLQIVLQATKQFRSVKLPLVAVWLEALDLGLAALEAQHNVPALRAGAAE